MTDNIGTIIEDLKERKEADNRSFLDNPEVKEALHRYDNVFYSDVVKTISKNLKSITEYFLFEPNDEKTGETIERVFRFHLSTLIDENIIEDFNIIDNINDEADYEIYYIIKVLPKGSEQYEKFTLVI